MSQPIAFPCPHCGATYGLTPEYLAQYGGQLTRCATCGGEVSLPVADAVQQSAVAPIPLLPSSGLAPAAAGAWSDGKVIIAHKDANVAHCCIKCGAPPARRAIQKRFYWHEPWVYVTILLGLLPYAIIAICVRKKGSVRYALCSRHHSRRLLSIFAGLGLTVVGIGLFFVAATTNDPGPFIAFGIFGLFGGLILALLASRTLTPTRIDDHYLWLKGAGPEFLRTLPSPQQPPAAAYPYPASRM